LIYNTFKIIVFIPNDVLCSHIAIQINIRMENIMVRVDFLLE
jgi:hypothetical protein